MSSDAPGPGQPVEDERRRRGLRVVALLILALALLGIAGYWHFRGKPDSAPLALAPARVTVSVVTSPGQPRAIGIFTIQNVGDVPAVIRSVELMDPDPGLRMVGVKIATPPSSVGTDFWPVHVEPGSTTLTPPTAEVAGGARFQVIIGVDASAVGSYSASGILVHYEVGEEAFTLAEPDGIRLCVSTGNPAGPCPAPD